MAGMPPDRASFLKLYPTIADHLADAIDALYKLHPVPSASVGPVDPTESRIERGDASGKRLGQYLLIRKIGQGAMGADYEAEDMISHRRVAVRLTHDNLLSEADQKRFRREASIAASLHHPHIVPILHVSEDGDQFFYVMPLIDGGSLDQWLDGSAQSAQHFLTHYNETLTSSYKPDAETSTGPPHLDSPP